MEKNNSKFTTHNSQFNKIAIFQKKEIRKTIHNDEWWFVIEDVVLALTDSKDPKQYIQKLKQRDSELKKGWVQIVRTLLIETSGGKQKMICANTEGIFRIIQSIPSPKAEPFKRWLAKTGYERVQEIENPELATKRTRALYQAKGYSADWIETLSTKLKHLKIKGSSATRLKLYRSFYQKYQNISPTVSAQSAALAISPTVSVESFQQYFGSIINQLADKFHIGIGDNQMKISGFQVRTNE